MISTLKELFRLIESPLRLLGAFLLAQTAGLVLMMFMSGFGITEFRFKILMNSICILGVNTAAHFLLCGGVRLPEKCERYSRLEPIAVFLSAVLLSCLAALLLSFIFGTADSVETASSMQGLDFWLYGLYTVILAPISEELAFRGAALSRLSADGRYVSAALFSALFFAVYHMNLPQLPYTFVFGYLLAVLAQRSGSIIPCILVHAANNLLTLVIGRIEALQVFVDLGLPIVGGAALVWLALTKRLWRSGGKGT